MLGRRDGGSYSGGATGGNAVKVTAEALLLAELFLYQLGLPRKFFLVRVFVGVHAGAAGVSYSKSEIFIKQDLHTARATEHPNPKSPLYAVNLLTALVPSEMACLDSSNGKATLVAA